MRKYIGSVLLFLLVACAAFAQSTLPVTAVGGKYLASNYSTWSDSSVNSVAAGAGTMTLSNCYPKVGNPTNIRPIFLFSATVPVTIVDGALTETVTPSSVTSPTANTASSVNPFNCSITATFTNAHNGGVLIVSGDNGLAEAINDAHGTGGVVVMDPSSGITPTNLTSNTAIYHNVSLEDDTSGAVQYWNPQGGLTTLAAPATLTAVTVGFGLNGANTTAGTYTGTNTYNTCIAYVDIYGQEGPCSTAFSGLTAGTGAVNQIGFSAPAASTGAVGYTVYISLTGGGSTLQYKVPLATYSLGRMTGNSVCTLTTIETVTAACAVANTTYNQTGSAAIVSALTVNTSPIQPASTVVSTTAIYVPNAGGRTTYTYVPGSHLGTPGVPVGVLPYVISAADATTVPSVLGTINLAPNFMNYVGRTIEICGYATTTASTATIENIQFQWDAIGQNTAGKGVPIADLTATNTWATTGHLSFCAQFQTTVAGTTATAGSINSLAGFLGSAGVTLAAASGGGNALTGAQASLNLNSEARINVIYVHTTGTDGAALTLQSLTARVVN